jgi:hypothetical protein
MIGSKRLLTAAVTLVLIAGCADRPPKAGSEVTASRVASTGTVTKLDFVTSLNADCTFIDYGTIRALEPPSHGTLTFERGSDFTNFAMNNQRFDCNKRRSQGTFLNYRSDPGYAGSDTTKVEIILPDASLRTVTYRLKVGTTAEQQGAKDISVARTSVSGSVQKLDFQYSINPDCTSIGETKIRVTKAPSHGTLKIEQGEDYTAFAKNNARYDCNKQKVPGSLVYYQSEAGYTGQDSARVEVSFPEGNLRSISYTLIVK